MGKPAEISPDRLSGGGRGRTGVLRWRHLRRLRAYSIDRISLEPGSIDKGGLQPVGVILLPDVPTLCWVSSRILVTGRRSDSAGTF